jgi:NADP-dependent 3-hydroxy acid dehydrogenase YdfG
VNTHLGTRTFTLADQFRFAALSGDWNPLHVDAVAARRTMFGEPLVHGVHLAAWALDAALRNRGERPRIDKIRAAFSQPTYLERPVSLELLSSADPATMVVIATSGGAKVLELSVVFGTGSASCAPLPSESWPEPIPAREISREDLPTAAGAVAVVLDAALATELFPRLAAEYGDALAELLATTRIVGMFCPGLHSVYGGLTLLRRVPRAPTKEVVYCVASANLRYSLAVLSIEGPTFEGKLETFYRPPPSPPLSMTKVASAVFAGELASQRALVVGGSRGLGEAFAKAIAAGGGEVCLTYHRGRVEAQRVVDDIVNAGGRASTFALDVSAPGNLQGRWPVAWMPTHVYYFATPFIRVDKNAPFSTTDYELFARYYVTGLHATVRAVCALGATDLTVWTPSTTFLDGLERGTASYCAAKAAMEELARHLPSMLPVRVLTPRLPRAATDQTAGLIARSSADPVELAVRHVRAAQLEPEAQAKIGTSSL